MCRRWQLMEPEKNLLGQFVFTETLLWSNLEKTDELRIGQDMGFLYRIDIFYMGLQQCIHYILSGYWILNQCGCHEVS